MQVQRHFERSGGLWLPQYGIRPSLPRVPAGYRLASIVQKPALYSNANANTIALTVSSTAASNLLVIGSINFDTRTVSSIADNIGTNSYAQATSAAATQSNFKSDIWHCFSTAAGVTTITLTFSGAAGTFEKLICCYEVSGLLGAAYDLGNNGNSASSIGNNVPGASVATTSTNGFILAIALLHFGVLENPTTGNEFTSGSVAADAPADALAACSLLSTTAAAHAAAWRNNSDGPYVTSTAAYKQGFVLPTENRFANGWAIQQRTC